MPNFSESERKRLWEEWREAKEAQRAAMLRVAKLEQRMRDDPKMQDDLGDYYA